MPNTFRSGVATKNTAGMTPELVHLMVIFQQRQVIFLVIPVYQYGNKHLIAGNSFGLSLAVSCLPLHAASEFVGVSLPRPAEAAGRLIQFVGRPLWCGLTHTAATARMINFTLSR